MKPLPRPKPPPPFKLGPRKNGHDEPLPPPPKWTSTMRCLRFLIPPPLAVAPCRCTLYPDCALMCKAHEAANDTGPCAALFEEHRAAIEAHEAKMGFTPITGRPRNINAFITHHP